MSKAIVREVAGQLVLDDPDALAVVRAVNKHNCRATLEAQSGRVAQFRRRMSERGDAPSDVVIVLINVDDPLGGPLAEALMPGTDWQPIRDRGEVPFARGLADRVGIQSFLDEFDSDAGAKLRGMTDAVVVVDHGVAEAFNADTDGAAAGEGKE